MALDGNSVGQFLSDLAGGTVDTVEIRSNLTPTVSLSLREALAPSGAPPSPLLRLVQPAVVLTGPAGRLPVAPYGEPTADVGGLGLFVVVAVIFAAGYILGRAG